MVSLHVLTVVFCSLKGLYNMVKRQPHEGGRATAFHGALAADKQLFLIFLYFLNRKCTLYFFWPHLHVLYYPLYYLFKIVE